MHNLNLEFSKKKLRLLLLNGSGDLICKEESDFNFDINDESNYKNIREEVASEFSEILDKFVNIKSKEPWTAGILVDTAQTFLSIVPIDFSEDENNINSHILWELSNYYPETYKDFNIKYYRFNNKRLSENIDEVLLIAVNKNKIECIKTLCNSNNVKIKNVDIDQFAVEKCLKKNHHNDIKGKTILIIGCKDERLDFSLLYKEQLKHYDFEIIKEADYRKSLAHQINFYVTMFGKIEEIYLYGNAIVSKVKDFFEEQFSDVSVSYIDSSVEGAKFAPLYGLALKNINQSN